MNAGRNLPAGGQWTDPVTARDDDPRGPEGVRELFTAATADQSPSDTTFILGLGFDPRCLSALQRFVEVAGSPRVLALDLQSDPSAGDPALAERRQANQEALHELIPPDQLTTHPFPHVEDAMSAGRLLAQDVTSKEMLTDARNVAIDISGLPTSLYFPIISALLHVFDNVAGDPRNLLAVVCENPHLDARILAQGVSEVRPLAGFGQGLRGERDADRVVVWTPILGEGEAASLKAIADWLSPTEVCPILPFPARDPRRADKLILEHRELLVDIFDVSPNSFIYAAETNPFDLYRALSRFATDYNHALEPLGGATVVLSAHGSKLLGLGGLLAAHELQLPVVGARTSHYSLDPAAYDPGERSQDHLACLWLRGTPYAVPTEQ